MRLPWLSSRRMFRRGSSLPYGAIDLHAMSSCPSYTNSVPLRNISIPGRDVGGSSTSPNSWYPTYPIPEQEWCHGHGRSVGRMLAQSMTPFGQLRESEMLCKSSRFESNVGFRSLRMSRCVFVLLLAPRIAADVVFVVALPCIVLVVNTLQDPLSRLLKMDR
jgi:hypothetical protein